MTCPFCRGTLGVEAKFCVHCGRALQALETPDRPASWLGKERLGTGSWSELKGSLFLYVLLMGCCLLHGLTERLVSGPQIATGFDGLFIALTLGFLARRWEEIKPVFRFTLPDAKTILMLSGACLLTFLFLNLYFSAFTYFNWPVQKISDFYLKAGWPLWSVFLLVSVEPGIIEEIAFRGILQTQLAKILSPSEALIIQAALFSVLHLSPAIFVSHFVMGLLLGWVRLRVQHIYFGMLLHMGWNAWVLAQEVSK